MISVKVLPEKGIKAIDFSQIMQKKYTNFDDFGQDIQWFVHYCRVMNHKKIKPQAEDLLQYIIDEVENIQNCEECFDNISKHGKSGFNLACKSPHLIVWAQSDGYGFWPAKVMNVENQNNMVNVRFFGEHTASTTIPADQCLLYMKKRPVNDATSNDSEDLDEFQKAEEVSFFFWFSYCFLLNFFFFLLFRMPNNTFPT